MLSLTLVLAAAATASSAEAIRLYDEGAYLEACNALRALDAESRLDGPLLYRLFFCERVGGDENAAQKALDRARKSLEESNPSARTVEVPFYLANTYGNMGRGSEAKAIAEAATRKLESGAFETPTSAIGFFQVAKLYQDQGRQDDAIRWYGRAAEAFDPKGPLYGNNLRWALRYIGSVAFSRADFTGAEAAFSKLTALGSVPAADWSALAAARARLGNYGPAASAWRMAVTLDAENSDDPRYSARLADSAARLAPLPLAPPDGKAFKSMSREELEAAMKTQVTDARTAFVAAAAVLGTVEDRTKARPLDPKMRSELQAKLDGAKRLFVSAALEYAVRRYPIRETAFKEGYAVMVFQDREWELPPDPAP